MTSLRSGSSVGKMATSGSSHKSWSMRELRVRSGLGRQSGSATRPWRPSTEPSRGFIMVVDDEVEQVYVSALHRGTGVADVLMDEAERQARANGYGKAWLAVVAGNASTGLLRASRMVGRGTVRLRRQGDAGPIVVPCHRYTKGL